jgi:hypothetical protein
MVALMAQKAGLTYTNYVVTRTMDDFKHDCDAWMTGWAKPLTAIFGDKDKQTVVTSIDSTGKTAEVKRSKVPSHHRRLNGYNYNTFDLGPIAESGYKATDAEKALWNADLGQLKKTFSGLHKSYERPL